jgi:hypothetical protein
MNIPILVMIDSILRAISVRNKWIGFQQYGILNDIIS